MRQTRYAAVILSVVLFATACPPLDEPGFPDALEATCPTSDRGAVVGEVSDGNITLYLSNQSFDRSPVDFQVELDNMPLIDVALAVCNQHEFVAYHFELPQGDHWVRVTSDHGLAVGQTRVTVGDLPVWGFVSYWFDTDDGTGTFHFQFQNEPIKFQ
jgi:hypothetical protein